MIRQVLIGITVLVTMCVDASAQETHVFSDGLLANFPSRYGREAVYTDELAFRLYAGSLKTPALNDTVGRNDQGQPIYWRALAADSGGQLRWRNNNSGRPPAGPGVQTAGLRGGLGPGGGYIYLTYVAKKAGLAILNAKGNSGVFINGIQHAGDPYSMGFLHIPVFLKKGLNEFYLRGTSVSAKLEFPPKEVLLKTDDPTLPFIVIGKQNGIQQGAIVVINGSKKPLAGLHVIATLEGKELNSDIPEVPALGSRKVAFSFDGTNVNLSGKYSCQLQLYAGRKLLDTGKVEITAVNENESFNSSFVSDIDGSLQYYSVTPSSSPDSNQALFFSVHGAGVEGINQARAYKAKDWGNLVAPTNRRPRGFNWEDWGRLDALEVLAIATKRFRPDPAAIYLTGHSMGGHGTWFLGATYPDKWAAIAPCAGYPTLKGYGSADGLVPDSSADPLEQILLRAGNQSDVIRLADNYKAHGVYIFHGDDDRTVSVGYARQMRALLGKFHTDLSYYEYPGGSHWFGDHSVDWKPLFAFFKWHQRLPDSSIHNIDFSTANPGISDSYRWASIQQQEKPLAYSRIWLAEKADSIKGKTENVKALRLNLNALAIGRKLQIVLDSGNAVPVTRSPDNNSVLLKKENGQWEMAESLLASEKNPLRSGTFKDAFRNRMVFVYGTTGNAAENAWSQEKARFDAESWYYRGNGAVDIISDKQYDTLRYKDRGVVLYGNSQTNAAYKILLSDCPIQVSRGVVIAGNDEWEGDDLGAYIVWPIRHSKVASVAVVAGTGIKGMAAVSANQYFAGASGFPDYMIFGLTMLQKGPKGLKTAGFFTNDWKLAR